MEKVNKSGIIFKFVLASFLLLFLFSFYFGANEIPSLNEFLKAVFEPISLVEDPLSDIVNSLQSIVEFFQGGGLPNLENLFDLLTAPFRILIRGLAAIIMVITNVIGLFS